MRTTSSHPVLELMRERARVGSRPGNRSDGARLGLAIEGGAMRGVVSAGMVHALEELGMHSTFDAVYGSSAGAVNGSYFVASQVAPCISIYFEDINNANFISLGRFVTRSPVMSLAYLFDDVMTRRKVLDWQAVLDSPVQLKIAASSLDELRVKLQSGFRDREHLFAFLRASSTIPLLAGPPAEVDGKRFLDALLFEPIPYRSAARDGCTHVLVLLTRPDGNLNGTPSLFERHVLGRWIAALEPRLRDAYLAQEHAYDDRIRRLKAESAGARQRRDEAPCFCALSLPASTPPIRWLERDRDRLEAAAAAGYATVEAAIGDSTSLE